MKRMMGIVMVVALAGAGVAWAQTADFGIQRSAVGKMHQLQQTLGQEPLSSLYTKNQSLALKAVEEGKKLLEAGNLDGAEAEFQKALKLSDMFFEANAYLGIVERQRGRLDKAIDQFAESLAAFGRFKEHLVARKKDYIKRLELMVNLMEKELDARHVNYGGGSSMEQATQFKFQEILEGNPTYHEAKITELKNYLSSLKDELARDEQMQYPAFFRLKYGNTLFMARRYAAAHVQLRLAVAADPNLGPAYANLALLNLMKGDDRRAVEMWKKAKSLNVKMNPELEQVLQERASKL